MNPSSRIQKDERETGEETLRLIAGLPAPEGLEERVRAALRTAPSQGRLLTWPQALRADAGWVRAAAAAAIVTIVAGGGWGVYTHIQPWQAVKTPGVPARVGNAGEFTGAGAVRSPQTLKPPVVSAQVDQGKAKPARKGVHKTPVVKTQAGKAPQQATAAK